MEVKQQQVRPMRKQRCDKMDEDVKREARNSVVRHYCQKNKEKLRLKAKVYYEANKAKISVRRKEQRVKAKALKLEVLAKDNVHIGRVIPAVEV